jgi:hypothetical protein
VRSANLHSGDELCNPLEMFRTIGLWSGPGERDWFIWRDVIKCSYDLIFDKNQPRKAGAARECQFLRNVWRHSMNRVIRGSPRYDCDKSSRITQVSFEFWNAPGLGLPIGD